MIEVGESVVDDLVVGQLANLVLGPLAGYPLAGLLTADGVALHDALKAQLLGGGDDDDAVDVVVGSRLKHDATLEPLESALLEIGKDGGMDDGVDGGGILVGG